MVTIIGLKKSKDNQTVCTVWYLNLIFKKIKGMTDSDEDSDTIPIRKRKIKEISIPNGLLNGPVKHKKIKTPDAPKELFPLHSLCAFIGMRGSGKAHAMVNLAKRYLDEGCFTRVFIISPTYVFRGKGPDCTEGQGSRMIAETNA